MLECRIVAMPTTISSLLTLSTGRLRAIRLSDPYSCFIVHSDAELLTPLVLLIATDDLKMHLTIFDDFI